MNVSGTSPSASRSVFRPVGFNGTPVAKSADGASSSTVEGDFLTYAKMSPMERMRANILKGMGLTEEQLGALPDEQKQKVEDQIKESIKKMISKGGQKGQLIDVSA